MSFRSEQAPSFDSKVLAHCRLQPVQKVRLNSSHRLRLSFRVLPIQHRSGLLFDSVQALVEHRSIASPEVWSPATFSQQQRATYFRWFPNQRLSFVLGLSQPLDALLPLLPAELISSRSRTWGYPYEVLFLLWCCTSSRKPRPSCPFVGFRVYTPKKARPKTRG